MMRWISSARSTLPDEPRPVHVPLPEGGQGYGQADQPGPLHRHQMCIRDSLQAGRTPAEVSGLAREGRLMGFFGPERPEELSRIATCTIVESGREQRFYTMDFG